MQITERVWQVGGSGLTAVEDATIYLIRFGEAAALIDAGCVSGSQALFDHIAGAIPGNAPITRLFLTHSHFDHTGGAEAVRRRYGCKVVAFRGLPGTRGDQKVHRIVYVIAVSCRS